MSAFPHSRILVIDDEEYFRLFLSNLFENEEIEVHACSRGGEALELLRKETFDLLVVDYQLPDMLGLEILDWLQEQGIQTPRIMVTAYGSIDIAVQALKKGAADFFTKPLADPHAFVRFLNRTLNRKEALPPMPLAEPSAVLSARPHLAPPDSRPAAEVTSTRVREMCARLSQPVRLSRREYEITAYLLRGLSNKEIAAALYISERTVKNHLTSIYQKFGVDGRAQLFNRLLVLGA